MTTVHHANDVRIFQKQCLSLKAAGYEVHLVARESLENPQGVISHELGGDQGLMDRLKAQGRLVEKLEEINGDLYHFHDPELLPIATRLKKKTEAVFVYDKHESVKGKAGLGKAVGLLEKQFISKMDAVIVAEESYLAELPSGHPVVAEVLNYYKDSGRLPRTKKAPSEGEVLQLVYSGFVSRHRGLDAMLELAEELKSKHIDFLITIAGKCQIDADRQWMEKQLERRRLRSSFRLLGWEKYISQGQIEECVEQAHLALCLLDPLANYTESIPTKFYEYMHAGLPIICSDFPLWEEFMEKNPVGICLTPKGKPGQILAAIEQLMDEETYNSLSDVANLLSQNYLWVKMEKNLLNLYNDLLV